MELKDFLARELVKTYMYRKDVSKETKKHLIKFAEEIIDAYDNIMPQLEEAYEEEIAENFDEDGDYIYEEIDCHCTGSGHLRKSVCRLRQDRIRRSGAPRPELRGGDPGKSLQRHYRDRSGLLPQE